MKHKAFLRMEAAAGAVVFLCAVFLHFLYDLSSHSVIGALFGSVNESVWEHLKIFAIPYIGYFIIEVLWSRVPLCRIFPAKAAGLVVMWAGIVAVHYLWISFFGTSSAVADIITGAVFSFLSHLVSYKLVVSDLNIDSFFYTGLLTIALCLIMILCFSYFPPHSEIFRDPVSNTYGVISPEIHARCEALDKMQDKTQ